MATRVYLSPAQHANPGAVGGYREDAWCRKVANVACDLLNDVPGIVARVSTNWSWDNYKGAKDESNAWGADIHVPIHTNAGNGQMRGSDTFHAPTSTAGKKLATILLKHISQVSGTKRGVHEKRWTELTFTYAVAGYLELDFHDNPAGCRHIMANVDAFGRAIAAGVCEYLGIAFATGPSLADWKRAMTVAAAEKGVKVPAGLNYAETFGDPARALAERLNKALGLSISARLTEALKAKLEPYLSGAAQKSGPDVSAATLRLRKDFLALPRSEREWVLRYAGRWHTKGS